MSRSTLTIGNLGEDFILPPRLFPILAELKEKQFTVTILDLEDKSFIVHNAFFDISDTSEVYYSRIAEMSSFQFNGVCTTIFLEYFDL